MNLGRQVVILSLGLLACAEDQTPIPAVGPLASLPRHVSFGLPARTVAGLNGVVSNEDGQYVVPGTSIDWLYLFDSGASEGPPSPRDRLVEVQILEEVTDSVAVWQRWHAVVTEASRFLEAEPDCIRVGGPQFRVTRAEFVGTPAISVGVQIDVSDDGLEYEAFLVVAARERYARNEFESGFGHQRVDCPSIAGNL